MPKKSLLKRSLVWVIVIIFGFGAGYFSTPIYDFIWPAEGGGKVKLTDIKIDEPQQAETSNESPAEQYVSEGKAISAVKGLPFLAKSQDAINMNFTVEQKPSEAYPVWLVEVKQTYSDKIPDIMYVQVDAVSGSVMDLSKEEMQISGVGLGMTRREVEKAQGKTRKTKRVFDQELGQNVKIDNYNGLEVTYNATGRVTKVSALNSDFAGPKGVKISDAKERVLQLLGRGRTGPASMLAYFPLDDENQQLIVRLENNNVCELSLQNARAGN